MKKIIGVFLILVMLSINIVSIGAVNNPELINVETNTVKVLSNNSVLDLQTIFYNGRVYVPLRDLSIFLGIGLSVNEPTKEINLVTSSGNIEKSDIKLENGESSIEVIRNTYKLKTDGLDSFIDLFNYKSTNFVQIRYLSEIKGALLTWNAQDKTINIEIPKDKYIGKVNGDSMKQKDYDYFFSPSYYDLKNSAQDIKSEEFKAQEKDLKTRSFNSLAQRMLFLQKANSNGITLDANDISLINDTITNAVGANGGIVVFKDTLDEVGLSFYDFQRFNKDNRLITKLGDKLVSDETSLLKFYNENKTKYIESETRVAKHILISTINSETGEPYSVEKKAEAKKKADSILAKINAKEDFDKLMKENTEDPGLASNPAGYTFSKGQMVKQFEDAAFSMKVGQVSEVVETQYGYHIIKLEAINAEKQMTYETAKNSVINDYLKTIVDKWMAEVVIVNELK